MFLNASPAPQGEVNLEQNFTGSAPGKAMNIPEIATIILTFLGPRDMAKVSRVCRVSRAQYKTSPQLRTMAFFATVPHPPSLVTQIGHKALSEFGLPGAGINPHLFRNIIMDHDHSGAMTAMLFPSDVSLARNNSHVIYGQLKIFPGEKGVVFEFVLSGHGVHEENLLTIQEPLRDMRLMYPVLPITLLNKASWSQGRSMGIMHAKNKEVVLEDPTLGKIADVINEMWKEAVTWRPEPMPPGGGRRC